MAILRLLEAVLQHHCSSMLCLQQSRVSTIVYWFVQKMLWRHIVTFFSRSSFNLCSVFLPSPSVIFIVFFFAVVTAFQCVTKARMKASNPLSIWYELFTLLCFLAYSCNQAIMMALSHDMMALSPCFLYFRWNLQEFQHIVSNNSKSFRKSNSSNCSLIGASCRLPSLT